MLAQRILSGACARPLAKGPVLLRSIPAKRIRPISRIFTTTTSYRKDDARSRTVQHETQRRDPGANAAEGIKPETVSQAKPSGPQNQDPLLAEQTVSNKEQRKADWAIMKDMVQYLWPKNDFGTRWRVGLSVGLLVGAKVGTSSCEPECNPSLIVSLGPQCPSPFLLQEHCRLHEHRLCLGRWHGGCCGRDCHIRM